MTTNNERVADISKTIVIEKEVYEAVLRNSVKVADLEAENRRLKKVERKKGKLVNENDKLKRLLEECKNLINECIRSDYKDELCERIEEALK